MDIRELIAYAVDADTGKITWRLYDEPWKAANKADERRHLENAMNCLEGLT